MSEDNSSAESDDQRTERDPGGVGASEIPPESPASESELSLSDEVRRQQEKGTANTPGTPDNI